MILNVVNLLASDTNFFDTSAGHSEIKNNAVCALYIHLLFLLHQKHSLCNMVCKFMQYGM